MNKEQFEKLKSLVEEAVSVIKKNEGLSDGLFRYHFGNNGDIILEDAEEMEIAEEPVKYIYSVEDFSEYYSRDFIKDKVIEIYNKLKKDNEDMDEVLKKFLSDLRNKKKKKYKIALKVENIKIDMDSEYRLVDSVIKILKEEDFIPENRQLIKSMGEISLNSTYIFTTVSAGDVEKAKELGLYEFIVSLNLFRLYYPWFTPILEGSTIPSKHTFIVFDIEKESSISTLSRISIENKGFHKLYIDNNLYNGLKKNGIKNLEGDTEIANPQHDTEIRKIIKSCLYWYGLGLDAKRPSEKLLFFVTILETILKKGEERNELRRTVAERTTLFLGTSFDERKKILYEVKKIYDVRSKVVHTGIQISDKYTVDSAEKYAKKVLMKIIMVMDKFNRNFEEFIDYLDDLKLKAKDELIDFGDD